MPLPPHRPKPPKQDRSGHPLYLKSHDLRRGDVLMSYGTGRIPWLIRRLDGGWFSHASFYDGASITQAQGDGVVSVSVQQLLTRQQYVDVYRFRSADGQELGSPGWPAKPVVDAVNGYRGKPFAMHDLIFAAVLIVTHPDRVPPGLRRSVRKVLSKAVTMLRDTVISQNKEHLVCTELIYRGYEEAEPPPRYRLQLPVRHLELSAASADTPAIEEAVAEAAELGELQRQFAAMYAIHKARHAAVASASIMGVPFEAPLDFEMARLEPADHLSPRALHRSPNLREVGRIRLQDFS